MKKTVKLPTKSEKLKVSKSKEFKKWMQDVEEYIELLVSFTSVKKAADALSLKDDAPPYDFEKVFMAKAKPEHAARWFLSYVLTYGCYSDDTPTN